MINNLIGEIAHTFRQPILVVGGGPSAPEDLAALQASGTDLSAFLIIGANEHVLRLGLEPDFVVANDDVHTMLHVRQEPRLRAMLPGVPLISRHWWADYRLHDWRLVCNSGFKAIGVASVLGGNPIVPIGFDCYRGKTYFHDPDTGNINLSRELEHFSKQMRAVKDFVEHAPVRPVSGPLLQFFPAFDPSEVFAPYEPTSNAARLRRAEKRVMRAAEEVGWEASTAPAKWVFSMSADEARGVAQNAGFTDITTWDLTDVEGELARHQAAIREEEARMAALVDKIRNGARPASRRLADVDLRRMIRQMEQGVPDSTIGRGLGIPGEQVRWVRQALDIPLAV